MMLSAMCRRAWAPRLLILCLGALPPALPAQSLGMADVHAWSAFVPPAPEPARAAPLPDAAWQDIQRTGPWTRPAQARLAADAQGLLDLLSGARWAEALDWLKARQPDLNQRAEDGRTPLTMVASAGELALLREMLRQGAQPDQVGAAGMTPLGAAAFAGHELLVRDLLREGARTDVPGATGQLPLHLACAAGHPRVAALLVQGGADWRWPNREGRHAVSEAALFGQIPVLQWLAGQGADLAAPDLYRLNAVHAAALGRQPATVAWLRGQGVPVASALSQVLIEQMDLPQPP